MNRHELMLIPHIRVMCKNLQFYIWKDFTAVILHVWVSDKSHIAAPRANICVCWCSAFHLLSAWLPVTFVIIHLAVYTWSFRKWHCPAGETERWWMRVLVIIKMVSSDYCLDSLESLGGGLWACLCMIVLIMWILPERGSIPWAGYTGLNKAEKASWSSTHMHLFISECGLKTFFPLFSWFCQSI